MTVEVFEKRYQAKDFSGVVMAEATAAKTASRPAFTPIFHNHYTNQTWSNKAILKDEVRKEFDLIGTVGFMYFDYET